MRLHPDVLLGDGTVAPLGDGHHPATTLELADHARPLSRPEPDRMGRDLHGRATCGLDERLHGVDVLLNPVRLRLPVDIHENVVGVVTGEDAMPVRSVPAREIEVIHTLEIARYHVVSHARGLLPG